jgi:hypothetical protein
MDSIYLTQVMFCRTGSFPSACRATAPITTFKKLQAQYGLPQLVPWDAALASDSAAFQPFTAVESEID